MKLVVLGSNSLGNCYLLETESEALIIEAGCKLSEVKKALKWKLSKVCGAVVTHRHKDHAAYVKDFIKAGITVLALEDVFNEQGITGLSFRKDIQPNKGYIVGSFKVFAFQVVHDAPCVGYIIEHSDMGKMLFITDTMMCEYVFEPMNHILIEANYADDILNRRIDNGDIPASMKPRLIQSHMELGTTKGILKANDLSDCNEVVLIHISDGNADESRFVSEVSEVTGLPVYAANAGLEIDLSKNPY